MAATSPGDRLPTEPELAARHDVSRITARQAVMQLVREGLVVRRQGKGSFVAEPPVHHEAVTWLKVVCRREFSSTSVGSESR